MKKLVILAVAAVATVAANAAAYSWGSTGSRGAGTIYVDSSTKIGGEITAYLLCTETLTQTALVSGLRDGSINIADKAIASATTTTTSAGQIAVKNFEYGVGAKDLYFAIINGDNVLVSSIKSVEGQELGTASALWTDTAAATFSKNNFADADFSAAGWYSTVPEPTSGLLLLLGMAGLALKRKQA